MRTVLSKFLIVASCLGLHAGTPALVHSIQKAFTQGGKLELHLASGTYDIQAGASDRILVSWNDPGWKKPTVHLDHQDNRAVLRVSHTPHGDFRVRVEVPPTCDIHARLTAGVLTIGPLMGHKDIENRVGEIFIAVGEPGNHARVEASVGVGELVAKPFKEKHGGFFRSFHWSGLGAQQLRVKSGIGSITLR